jgi:hypothetical protein
MTASYRDPGHGSRTRAQRIPPEFQATLGWSLERTGGRWWRWPLAALVFVAVGIVGFIVVSLMAGVARRAGADNLPVTLLVWFGILASAVIGAYVALRVSRPPERWVPRERLMAVKSDMQRRLEAGAEGEFITGAILKPLENEGYVVRHSVEIPGEERPMDHVVVGPTGLFVVESKYYVEDVHPVHGRLFGDGTPLDGQVALLRHQCDVMWREVGAAAGISVRSVFSMVGNQTTPAFALDHSLWCVPGRDLPMVLRSWHPRRLEPELVAWLASKIDQVFDTGLADQVEVPPPPLHKALVGTPCDRPGCTGHRALAESHVGPYLTCTENPDGGCDRRWTLDGWPLQDRTV